MTQQPKTEWLDALKREAVQWYKERFYRPAIIGMPSDREVLFDFIDHLAQRGVLVPDGWVAVPREPNVDMVDTAVNHALAIKLCGSETWRTYMTSVYKTMLAAAPKMKGKE